MSTNYVLACKGKTLPLSTPVVMGILNVTPDSFFDGGKYQSYSQMIDAAGLMIEDGAQIIDVGGYSTRPGADEVPVKEELKRVLPVIEKLRKDFPHVIISIDTFRAEVAEKAVSVGADMVNDVTGGQTDAYMYDTVAALQVPYILMHSRGTPKTMQQLNQYDDLMIDLLNYFSHRISLLREKGIKDIIVDPGFGFAKNISQNFECLQKFHLLKALDCPLLAGLSRKSMIWKTLKITPNEALNGTTALHFYALQQGAHIIRAHDVKEALQTITLYTQLCSQAL
jgi:dihydropteroate synthase